MTTKENMFGKSLALKSGTYNENMSLMGMLRKEQDPKYDGENNVENRIMRKLKKTKIKEFCQILAICWIGDL